MSFPSNESFARHSKKILKKSKTLGNKQEYTPLQLDATFKARINDNEAVKNYLEFNLGKEAKQEKVNGDYVAFSIGDRPTQEDEHDDITNIDLNFTTPRQAANLWDNLLAQLEFDAIGEGKKIIVEGKKAAVAVKIPGATFNGVMQFAEKDGAVGIVTANLGDTRSIAVFPDGTHQVLSFDHSLDVENKDERQRVEKMGGEIKDGRLVKAVDRSGLAMARALGDVPYLGKGLSSIPEYSYLTVPQNQVRRTLIIQACDGVWDVLSPSLIANYLQYFSQGKALPQRTVQNFILARNNYQRLVNFWNKTIKPRLDLVDKYAQGTEQATQEGLQPIYDILPILDNLPQEKKITAKNCIAGLILDDRDKISNAKKASLKRALRECLILAAINHVKTAVKTASQQDDLLGNDKFTDQDFYQILTDCKTRANGNPAEFIRQVAYLYGSTDNLSCSVVKVEPNKLSYITDGHSGVQVASLIKQQLPLKLAKALSPLNQIEETIEFVKKANISDEKVRATLLLALDGQKDFVADEWSEMTRLYPDGVAPFGKDGKANPYFTNSETKVAIAEKRRETLATYVQDVDKITRTILEGKPEDDQQRKQSLAKIREFEDKHKDYVRYSTIEHHKPLKMFCFLVAGLVGAAIGGLTVGAACMLLTMAFGPGAIFGGAIGFAKGTVVGWMLGAQIAGAAIGATAFCANFSLFAKPTNGSRSFHHTLRGLTSYVSDYKGQDQKVKSQEAAAPIQKIKLS